MKHKVLTVTAQQGKATRNLIEFLHKFKVRTGWDRLVMNKRMSSKPNEYQLEVFYK